VVRLTVLGGCGAWPDAGQACSGYLVEHDGFRLLIDPGYAIVPRLLELTGADEIDAVFVTHGHPDHCVDLNPLLRARVVRDSAPAPPLPVYAPPGALTTVLALDGFRAMAESYDLHEFEPGSWLKIDPFTAETRLLPHSLPNAGIRLAAGDRVLMYTGDTGPTSDVVDLARDADVMLAEASYVDEVPGDTRRTLNSARQAGQQASAAAARHLLLTHLLPGTDPAASRAAAAASYDGQLGVATAGLVLDL
jgi:ribonuclease BN (tRNA processing enzyme)